MEATVAKAKATEAVVVVAEAEAKGAVLAKEAALVPKVVAVVVTRKRLGHALSAISLVMVIEMFAQMVRHTTHLKKFPARARSNQREATTPLVQLEVVGSDQGGGG